MKGKTILALAMALAGGSAHAETGPVGGPTWCRITGMVRGVLQEEMASTASPATHVMVPVVIVDVASAAPVDAAYQGDFCSRITTQDGGKPTGYYRLCDAAADFMTAETITGVVGLSKGGGRLCLAQIAVVK